MNSKLLILLVALTGQSVFCRPDSYESAEHFRFGPSFDSSEVNSIEIVALSSDDYSSDEIPLQFSYDPATDGEPEAFLDKMKGQLPPGAFFPPETLDSLKVVYNQYQSQPPAPKQEHLPEPTLSQLKKIDLKLNKAEVNRHNELRQLHGAPPLVYDETLAAYAQNYAEKISAKMAQGAEFKHNPDASKYWIGENMAGDGPTTGIWDAKRGIFDWGGNSWKPSYDGHSANMWYFTEIGAYKNNGNQPSDQPATGHFTQVVWKSTQKMGCGMACFKPVDGNDTSKNCNVICNYSPPGNVQGQKNYDENVNMDMDMQGYEQMKAGLTEQSLVQKLKSLDQ